MTAGWAEPYAQEQKSPPEKRKAADNDAHKGTRTKCDCIVSAKYVGGSRKVEALCELARWLKDGLDVNLHDHLTSAFDLKVRFGMTPRNRPPEPPK